MEGITWFRLTAIFALVVGALYILSPTFVGEDTESQLASAASSVEMTGARSGADLDLGFTVDGGSAPDAAVALEAALKAADVAVSDVSVEGSTVEVVLALGSSRAEVTEVAALLAPFVLYVGGEDTPLPAPNAEALAGFAGALPAGAAALEIPVAAATLGADGTAKLTLPDDAWPARQPVALLALAGRVIGWVTPDGTARPLGDDATNTAFSLLAAPYTGPAITLNEVSEVIGTTAGADALPVAEAVPSRVPAWVRGLMPSKRINLGLDLQGGIDLTLQVELEDAVLGQATRDIAYLKDAAVKEGMIIESVQRAHVAPVIEVTTDSSLSELQGFLRERLSDYIYSESDGNVHKFQMSDVRQGQVRDQAVEQVLETLRKRVDATGVKEPSIVKKGGGRINVQLPGLVDVQSAVDAIGTTAVLQFRMVDEEFDDALLEQMIQAAKDEMPEDQFLDDELLNRWLWDSKRLDRERMILWQYSEVAGETPERTVSLPLMADVVLTGNDVNDAGVGWDQTQSPYVSLEFKPRGGKIFCDVTGEAVGKRFAIILDEIITSAPSIREQICGGAAQIDMASAADPLQEAQNLALVLRTGALDAPVVVASVRQVGASLGADSIRQGSIGAVVGASIVLVFMMLWYRTSGLIADFALIVNVLLVLAALAQFGATLTLPGIAGIALTVGMAVDANIIIFERIREELRLGISPRKAVDVGFDKAVVAVLDANITTAIAGIVLYSYGTGPIKGFAVTLLVGIITTLVTALFVTRTLMELVTRSSTARLRI